MKLEGYDVVLNKNITYRFANENDKDMYGDSIPDGYIVFIKLSDCRIIDNGDGKSFYDCENSPIIPLMYLDSWYGIGESKERHITKGITINDEFVNSYKHSSIYFAHNGMVYTGSINELND